MTDILTAEYLGACDREPGLRRAMVEARLPPAFSDSYEKLLLPRPLFVEHRRVEAFVHDMVALFAILISLPERIYEGSLVRYCQELGMDERIAALMRLGATGQPDLWGRSDAYRSDGEFKLLEFNLGSELGGVDIAQVNAALLEVPAFGGFAGSHQLAYVDTATVLAENLRRQAALVCGSGEPVVALVEGPGGLVEHANVFRAIQEALRARGIDLLLGEIDQLRRRGDKAVLHGRPLDVILRYFAAYQVLESPDGPELLGMLAQLHHSGSTRLHMPLEANLFASKGSLALVHDPRVRRELSTDETAVVDRIVPWTRILDDGRRQRTTSERAELLEDCRARRESLIAKPGLGYGAVGAFLGRELTDAEWQRRLAGVEGGDYVVQDVVVADSEPMTNAGDGRREDWRANWGIFATEDGFAGAFVRALQPQDGAVISFANPQTRCTTVFTYSASPGAGTGTNR